MLDKLVSRLETDENKAKEKELIASSILLNEDVATLKRLSLIDNNTESKIVKSILSECVITDEMSHDHQKRVIMEAFDLDSLNEGVFQKIKDKLKRKNKTESVKIVLTDADISELQKFSSNILSDVRSIINKSSDIKEAVSKKQIDVVYDKKSIESVISKLNNGETIDEGDVYCEILEIDRSDYANLMGSNADKETMDKWIDLWGDLSTDISNSFKQKYPSVSKYIAIEMSDEHKESSIFIYNKAQFMKKSDGQNESIDYADEMNIVIQEVSNNYDELFSNVLNEGITRENVREFIGNIIEWIRKTITRIKETLFGRAKNNKEKMDEAMKDVKANSNPFEFTMNTYKNIYGMSLITSEQLNKSYRDSIEFEIDLTKDDRKKDIAKRLKLSGPNVSDIINSIAGEKVDMTVTNKVIQYAAESQEIRGRFIRSIESVESFLVAQIKNAEREYMKNPDDENRKKVFMRIHSTITGFLELATNIGSAYLTIGDEYIKIIETSTSKLKQYVNANESIDYDEDVESLNEGILFSTKKGREKVSQNIKTVEKAIETGLDMLEKSIPLLNKQVDLISKPFNENMIEPTKKFVEQAVKLDHDRGSDQELRKQSAAYIKLRMNKLFNRADYKSEEIKSEMEQFLKKCSKGGEYANRVDKLVTEMAKIDKRLMSVLEKAPEQDDIDPKHLEVLRSTVGEFKYFTTQLMLYSGDMHSTINSHKGKLLLSQNEGYAVFDTTDYDVLNEGAVRDFFKRAINNFKQNKQKVVDNKKTKDSQSDTSDTVNLPKKSEYDDLEFGDDISDLTEKKLLEILKDVDVWDGRGYPDKEFQDFIKSKKLKPFMDIGTGEYLYYSMADKNIYEELHGAGTLEDTFTKLGKFDEFKKQYMKEFNKDNEFMRIPGPSNQNECSLIVDGEEVDILTENAVKNLWQKLMNKFKSGLNKIKSTAIKVRKGKVEEPLTEGIFGAKKKNPPRFHQEADKVINKLKSMDAIRGYDIKVDHVKRNDEYSIFVKVPNQNLLYDKLVDTVRAFASDKYMIYKHDKDNGDVTVFLASPDYPNLTITMAVPNQNDFTGMAMNDDFFFPLYLSYNDPPILQPKEQSQNESSLIVDGEEVDVLNEGVVGKIISKFASKIKEKIDKKKAKKKSEYKRAEPDKVLKSDLKNERESFKKEFYKILGKYPMVKSEFYKEDDVYDDQFTPEYEYIMRYGVVYGDEIEDNEIVGFSDKLSDQTELFVKDVREAAKKMKYHEFVVYTQAVGAWCQIEYNGYYIGVDKLDGEQSQNETYVVFDTTDYDETLNENV